jgi:hypothetical protein
MLRNIPTHRAKFAVRLVGELLEFSFRAKFARDSSSGIAEGARITTAAEGGSRVGGVSA